MSRLADLSWTDVAGRLESGLGTVVFAVGSTEQHGPHLPLSTDTMLGDAIADGVCRQWPDAVRAPTLPFGVSPHHMMFPGTITLSTSTFKSVVHEVLESLAAHGFQQILVVPSHGGNFAPVAELIAESGGVVGDSRVAAATDLMAFIRVLESIGLTDGFGAEVSGSHAGEAETSIVLAMRPDLAHMDRAAVGFTERFDEMAAARLFTEGTRALSEIGVLGDARPATAERGHRYLDALVDLTVVALREQLAAGTAA